ncbi:uncharacterized protein LOC130747708 [Lotus japonicus]|uniref:uncharacterized protein LOC130747708 n=1 Tax=Lotus japonicus TaxID=34305 RepID=UPI00258847F3|nr:uncharacterized protein LOC130747708 [Lotus japonicus]XP_057456708.1 uncharacterized protein LOC130747708 [Lotus japonicus]
MVAELQLQKVPKRNETKERDTEKPTIDLKRVSWVGAGPTSSLSLNPIPTHSLFSQHTPIQQPFSTTATVTTATMSTAEPDSKTYWCHECDMSVSLTPSPSPSPLSCPHCHTNFLELMDSPSAQNDAPSALFDVVFQDALALFSPTPATTTRRAVPVIAATHALLSCLDPTGVVHCAVCKDQIAVDAEAKQLPCEHLYHSDCITPWLELRGSCPLCRFCLEEDAVEEEENDGGDVAVRRELMVRLLELTEEDFYGLRTTLNHIVNRHAFLLESDDGSREAANREARGGGGESGS